MKNMLDMRKRESMRIADARFRRAVKVCQQITTWQELTAQGKYLDSLHNIVHLALIREYKLGANRARSKR